MIGAPRVASEQKQVQGQEQEQVREQEQEQEQEQGRLWWIIQLHRPVSADGRVGHRLPRQGAAEAVG